MPRFETISSPRKTAIRATTLLEAGYVATDPGSSPGGRLYCTAVAALTLQVICTSPDP